MNVTRWFNSAMWLLAIVLVMGGMMMMSKDNGRQRDEIYTYQMLALCDEATDTGALLTDTEGNQWYVEIALDEGVEYLVCVVDAGTDEVEDDEEESDTEESDEEESDEDEELDEEDDVDEEFDEEDDEVAPASNANQKDANAFAKLRTENKKYKDVIDFFDQRAKAMGLADIEDLMNKTKEAELKKEAEKQGIPLEYAKRLKELEDKVATQDAENANRIAQEKANRVKFTLDDFVQANKLGDKEVQKLAKDLLSDGITFDFLSNIPENTIPKILKSYLPDNVSKQKELEKKEKIKKELPLNSKSSTSTKTQEDDIDKIAKMLTSIQ